MPILDQLCLWGCKHMADEVGNICGDGQDTKEYPQGHQACSERTP